MPPTIDFSDQEEPQESSDLDGLDSEEEVAPVQPARAQAAYDPETGMRNESDAASEVVENLYQEPKASDRVLSRIQKAQERLDKAQYYRLILDQSLFSDESEIARQVEEEIRTFVCQRLEVLMGVQAEAPKTVVQVQQVARDFTDIEVKMLKAIAKAAEKKFHDGQTKAAEPAPAPTLRKVETPVKAEPEPQPKPQSVPPKRPPLPQPQLRRPQTQPARPASQQAIPIDPHRIPEKYKNDPTLTFKNGRALVQACDKDGVPVWEFNPKTKKSDIPFMKDITLPVRPSGAMPVPQPNYDQWNMIMNSQSGAMLSGAENRLAKVGAGKLFASTIVSNISSEPQQQSSDEGNQERP